MPNWCSTSYMIEGPHETLKKINDAILHHEVEEGSSPEWEGNILKALDIKWKRYDPDFPHQRHSYMRGFINEPPSLGENTLEFDAEEAWGVTDFGEVLEENFPDIKVYFIAEEPGMEIYITNDAEGKFFLTRYYVDTCIKNDYQSEYFETKEEAYKWLSDITQGKITNEEQVDDFNSDVENIDDFIYVHEFKIVNDQKEITQ